MRISLVVMIAVGIGCQSSGSTKSRLARDAGLFLPETIGALSLEDPGAFQPEFREAAAAAAQRLTQDGKNPAHSFAQISKVTDDELVVHVWPASMFGGSRPKGGGGKSLSFSRSEHKIVRAVAWQ